jgi:large subunit ribosomal protein L30
MAVKDAKKKTGAVPAKKLRIRLVRSLIGYPQNQRIVARGLGLRKINSEVVRPDSPEIRGMVNKITHVLKVEAIEEP